MYEEKFPLNQIDINIYNEIISFSNMFCIPFQVLNNLIYKEENKNALIESLKNQIYISNLKKLIHQKELLKISKLYNDNQIDYVFLKGSAINQLDSKYVRYSRDLDILVRKQSLSKAYDLLKKIGYQYLNPLVSDSTKFINNSHHLPILSNGNGALVEIHPELLKNRHIRSAH